MSAEQLPPPTLGAGDGSDGEDRARSNSTISGMTLRKSLTKVQDADVWATYQKGRKLGSGKSGQCYEGKHRVTKQVFAVKVIRVRDADADMRGRLLDEIEYMTEMDHPNIVKVFETFRSTRGDFALVMELLSGGELYEHLLDSEDGRYDEPVAARLFEMMCKAVSYIHGKKICHRDLKLENFVFDEASEEAQIKLIDFGLSRRHGLGIKRMKTAVGTPYYVAPEVIARDTDYDQSCDVWSLGVLLFMMLSGRPPFDAETDRGILQAIRKCAYNFSDPVWAKVSMPAKELIKRMLVADPSKRIKPADILVHPWVQQSASDSARGPVNAVIAKNLRNYMSVSALKRTTMEMIALSLNPSEIKGLQAEFEKIDVNKDGVLTLEEFQEALKHKMPQEEIQSLFAKLDGDCSGHIE
jgi:calcium-dependent protein kinase